MSIAKSVFGQKIQVVHWVAWDLTTFGIVKKYIPKFRKLDPMAQVVLYLALLLVSSFSAADGALVAEESQADGILVSLGQSIEGDNTYSNDLDNSVSKASPLAVQSFGTIAIINTLASYSSRGWTRFQPIRAPPVLLI